MALASGRWRVVSGQWSMASEWVLVSASSEWATWGGLKLDRRHSLL
jgi:hypothetical protein